VRWGHVLIGSPSVPRDPTITGTLQHVSDLEKLSLAMRRFSAERDWEKFHDPKSLTLALVGEVGELAELLQWLPAADVPVLVREQPLQRRLGEELADILLYLVRVADVVGVDLAAAAESKLLAGEQRFPADEVSGRAPERR
jgi:dCTP diphosphatase